MKEIKVSTHIILEVKKSKFIAYLVPYKEFKATKMRLKDEYPKARHIVYAYRYLNEFDQVVENQSDDGEPKGSSGPPALAVLRGNEMINTAVLIVRFFGGVKLGIGGLVRAYGLSVNEALSSAEFIDYKKINTMKCVIKFNALSKFDHFLKSLDNTSVTISKEFVRDGCQFIINAPEEQINIINNYVNA